MSIKSQNVTEEDWDYLIILDACRYDYFNNIYDEYLEGNLEKRKSNGSGTPEWLYKTFQEGMQHNISYFSANPYINGLGKSLKFLGENYDWKATDNFGHIVDLWDFAFSEEYQNVLPKNFIDVFYNKPKMDRCILHFMQPHHPYIHPESKVDEGWRTKKKLLSYKNDKKKNINFVKKARNYIFYDILRKFNFKLSTKWKIREFFNIPPILEFERIYRQFGEKIRYYYEYSLRSALKVIAENLDEFDGKLIITSDHGECFGEHNYWGHKCEFHVKTLIEVPWLEIKK